ncbi:MAG: hypothetical protein ACI3T9_04655 [Romboutsia timonensis]
MKFIKLSEAIADNGFNNMDDSIVTSDTKAQIKVPYQIGDAIQKHIRKRAEIEDRMKDKNKEIDELEKENQVDSHKDVKSDDLKKMYLSESLFEAYQDDPDYNQNFDKDKYGKYFDEDGKLIPELADEYFELTNGVNESLKESIDDGWPEELVNDPIIEKLDKFTYEMKHAVRGAYTGARTLSDLFDYLGDLIDEMNEFEDYVEYLSSTNESLKKNLTETLEDHFEDLYDQVYCNLTSSGTATINNALGVAYPPDKIGVDTSKPGKYGIVVSVEDESKLDKAKTVVEKINKALEKAGRKEDKLETKQSSFLKINKIKNKLNDEESKQTEIHQLTIFVPDERPVVKVEEKLKEDFEVEEIASETPSTSNEFGAASILNSLIQDEWQAIQGYNDAIATLSATDVDTDIINIFKDIAAEENIHIGQLQKALETISPNTSKIAEGEREGAEQLNQNVAEEE